MIEANTIRDWLPLEVVMRIIVSRANPLFRSLQHGILNELRVVSFNHDEFEYSWVRGWNECIINLSV